MSTTIDERVVSMQFDNKNFEKNVQTSLSTLDKLKQSLRLPGAAKGLENVGAAAKKCDLSPMSKAADSVKMKFSALEVMAVTALSNITNQAVNAGKRIIASLTIDPVKMGFQEYETQINAVQTILANTQSKGTTLDDVNAALDELNKYADKTIYNFTEMTRNIGTFTAAGVELDTSVSAIKGIANLAAISGSTSQQASTAMYQLSQALSSGTVKLMDWNSVVNAGMGGQVFQDALKETARLHGVAIDQMIEDQGSFRETLSDGWLSSEILLETLEKFTGDLSEAQLKQKGYTDEQIKGIMQLGQTANDAATKVKTFTQLMDTLKEAAQSGWTQTFELILGDFEEAKEFFTKLSDLFGNIINSSAESRNELLAGALNSNWDTFISKVNEAGISTEDFETKLRDVARDSGVSIDGLIDKYGSLEKAMTSGKIPTQLIIAVLEKFAGQGEKTSKATGDLTAKLEKFQKVVNDVWMGDYAAGEERVKALADAGYDYAEVQALVNKTVDGHKLTLEDLSDTQLESIGYTKEQVASIRKLADEAKKTGTPIRELIENLNKPSGRELLIDSLWNIIEAILNFRRIVQEAWKEIFGKTTSQQIYDAIEAFNKFTEKLWLSRTTATNLKKTFKGVFAIIDIVKTTISTAIKMAFRPLCEILGIAGTNILEITAAIGDALVAFRDWVKENKIINKTLTTIGAFIKNVIVGIITFTKAVVRLVRAFFELPAVQKVLGKVRDSFSSVFKKIGERLKDGREVISKFIERVKAMDGISLDNIGAVIKDFWNNVIGHFFNFKGLADSVKKSFKKITDTISDSVSKTNSRLGKFIDKIKSIIKFIKETLPAAVSIGIGVALIAGISGMAKVFSTVSAVISGFVDIVGRMSDVFKKVKGFISALKFESWTRSITNLAFAIAILAAAVIAMTFINQGKLWSSVGALAVLVAAVTILTVVLGKIPDVGEFNQLSALFLGLSVSLLLLALCLKTLAKTNFDQGLVGVKLLALLLGALTTAVVLVGKFGAVDAGRTTAGMLTIIGLAIGVKVLVDALEDISKIEFTSVENALVSVGSIISLVLSLGAVAAASTGFKFGAGLGLLMAVLSLKIFVEIVKELLKYDIMALEGELGGLAVFSLLFVGFMKLFTQAAKVGQYALKVGAGIAALAVALLLMAAVIKVFSKIDWNALAAAAPGILTSIALLAGIMAIMTFVLNGAETAGAQVAKAGVGLILIAGAIAIMAGIMHILGSLDEGEVQRAGDALIDIGVVFAGILVATKFANLAKDGIGSLIVVIAGLGVLTAAVIALTYIGKHNPNELTKAAVIVGGLALVFAAILFTTKFIPKGGFAMGSLIAMTAAIGVIAGAIVLVASMTSPEGAEKIANALAKTVLSLAALCIATSVLGKIDAKNAFKGLGVVAVLVAGLAAVLVGLGAVGGLVSTGVPILASMGSLFLPLLGLELVAGAMVAIGKIKVDKTFQGIMVFGAVIAGLSVILALMGGMASILSAGIAVMAEMTKLLAPLAIIAGLCLVLAGLSFVAPYALAGISPFGAVIAGLSVILALMGGMASILSAGIAVMAEMTKLLAPLAIMSGLCLVLALIGTFAHNSLAGIVALGALIGGLAFVLVMLEGNASSIETGISIMEKMAALAPALLVFTAICAVLTVVGFAAPAALAGLGVLALLILGLIAVLVAIGAIQEHLNATSKYIDVTREVFIKVGEAVDEIVAATSKVTPDALAGATRLVTMLLTLTASNLVESLTSFLTGKSSVEKFSEDLCTFGRAMADFSQIVSGNIDEGAIMAAANAGSVLSKLSSGLEKTGGLKQLFGGEKDLGDFGKSICNFGKKIAEFSETTSGISVEHLNGIIGEMNGLLNFMKSASSADLSGASSFNAALSNLSSTGIQNVVNAFNEATPRIANAVRSMFGTGVNEGMSYARGAVNSGVNMIVNGMLNAVRERTPEFKNAGMNIAMQLGSGVVAANPAVSATFSTFVNGLVSIARNSYSGFNTAGRYVTEGFASGIRSHTFAAEAAAAAMAKQARIAAEKALDEHSPSKEFYRVGSYAGQGFVNGLKDYETVSYNTGYSVGEYAASGITAGAKIAADAADALSENDISAPTITPVVDMSNVESAATKIPNVLNTGIAIGTSAVLAASINSSMSYNNEHSNDDVVDAINNLGKIIKDSSGDVINIGDITYDDGSAMSGLVGGLVRSIVMEARK